MVPLDGLALEKEGDNDGENGEGDNLLDHFQLEEIERTAVANETYAVCGNGEAVLEEGYPPGEEDDEDERPSGGYLHFLELKVTVPRKRHENV